MQGRHEVLRPAREPGIEREGDRRSAGDKERENRAGGLAGGFEAEDCKTACLCQVRLLIVLLLSHPADPRTRSRCVLPSSSRSSYTYSIVQWEAAQFYAMDEDMGMNIDIARLGSVEGTATVTYETRDRSAKAGLHYKAMKGMCVHPPRPKPIPGHPSPCMHPWPCRG